MSSSASPKRAPVRPRFDHRFVSRLAIFKEALKARRHELIKQRRLKISPDEPAADQVVLATVKEFLAAAKTYVPKLSSANLEEVLEAVVFFRKQLSTESNPPIEATLNLGIVPRVLDLVTKDSTLLDGDRERVRFEGAWMLCNLASGSSDQTRRLDKYNVTGRLLDLLRERQTRQGSSDLAEQIIWTLGNFAGDSVDFRNKLLHRGMLPVVLHFIASSSKLTMLRNATWTLSNLCRGKPVPDLALIAPALPALASLVHSSDDEVVTDALWALSYCSDGENARIQAVLESGCVAKLVDRLRSSQFSHKVPALRTLGNIVSGDDLQAQVAISHGFVDTLKDLLRSPKKNIRREALWAASNLAAGSRSQIQCLIDAQLFPSIDSILASGEWDLKKEACWIVTNAIHGGSPEQITFLGSVGIIATLFGQAEALLKDPRIESQMREAANRITKMTEGLQKEKRLAEQFLSAHAEEEQEEE